MKPGQPFDVERYTRSFPIVAVGIDTLEYTATLDLSSEHVKRLQELQDGAKCGAPELVELGGNPRPSEPLERPGIVFEPRKGGAKRYKWGLANEELGIRLWFTDDTADTTPNRVPGEDDEDVIDDEEQLDQVGPRPAPPASEKHGKVKVELGSHALWHFGAVDAYRLSRAIVCELLEIGNAWKARPARVDFCVDFQGVHFDEDDPLRAVTRAKRVWDHRDIEAVCAECDEPFLNPRSRFCNFCGTERSRTVKRHERAGAELVPDGLPATCETEVSAERCPNPALAKTRVAVGELPMRKFGGRRQRRAFTGWQFGSGDPLMGRLYNKSIEVDTKSPDKIWFYRRWEKSAGYVHADCPACGKEQREAVIVPADAPRTQWRDDNGELIIEAAVDDPAWIVPEKVPRKAKRKKKSGLARLARLLCTDCYKRGQRVVMRERQVMRLELEARGNLLTRFAPDGEHPIATVDDVIEHADTLWFYLVGAPYRQCINCGCVPVGKNQHKRYCHPCSEAWLLEHSRPLEAGELAGYWRSWRRRNGKPEPHHSWLVPRRAQLERAPRLDHEEKKQAWDFCRLERNSGWLEARDCSQNPDGDPRYWPVMDWWHYLQALHFSFAGPAVQQSRRLRLMANADINQNMMFGCSSSWGAVKADEIHEALVRELGRAPTARELCAGLDRASYGKLDPLERIAELSYKRALNALPPLALSPASVDSDDKRSPADQMIRRGSPPDANGERVYREIAFDADSITPTKGNRDGPKKGRAIPVR